MEPFIGQIIMFGGDFPPRGWAFCDGQLLSINENQALFSILGTIYGGDGRTSFGLPDLRGRAPMHAGDGPGLTPRRLGAKGGAEAVTLTVNEMPAHSHAAQLSNATANVNASLERGAGKASGGDFIAPVDGNFRQNGGGAPISGLSANITNLQGQVSVGKTGSNQAHSNMQPWATVNYIIALQGTFPSRS